MRHLRRYPTSRLGKIAMASSRHQITALCDGYIPGHPPIIFFFRNPQNFQVILDIYRRREIHVCESSCPLTTEEEFEFWGLGEIFLQPCCALKYFPKTVRYLETQGDNFFIVKHLSAHIEKHEEEVENEKNEERLQEEDFGDTLLGALRSYFWDMLEYPETSTAAQAMAAISMMFVVLSTITFLVESNLEHDNDIFSEGWESMNTTLMTHASTFSDEERKIILTITQVIDQLAISFFTIEYFARLLLTPNKRKFIFNKMNMVDLIAIIPFYLALLLEGLEDMEIIGKAGKIVRLIR